MQKKLSLALAAALAALGLAAGLFAFPAQADSRSDAYAAVAAEINALPASGYVLGTWARPSPNGHLCTFVVVESANGVAFIGDDRPLLGDLNPDNADYCASSPDEIHARIVTLLATWPSVAPTTTTAVTTTTAPVETTTTPATTTAAAPATTETTTTVAAPAAPPAQTVTVTTTVVLTDPTVNDRLTALEQRQQTDEARIATLEAKAGIIVGEPKNTAPFTNQV